MISTTTQACDGEWKHILGWKGLHKIQTFAWLVAHGRLLTNMRRHGWNAIVDPTRPYRGLEEESLIHVL